MTAGNLLKGIKCVGMCVKIYLVISDAGEIFVPIKELSRAEG